MKLILSLLFVAFGFTLVAAQNEQAPVVEKDIVYKDWVYKNVVTGRDMNLRKFTNGKKLVMVAYFAPWCPNWKHDVAFVQGLYEKYKGNGFDVIGIAEYDPEAAVKAHIETYKIGFPVVQESLLRTDKDTTLHAGYRRSVGDTRKWGSPWYIFLEPAKLEREGPVLAKKANVVNGELIKNDVENLIRDRLGLMPPDKTTGQIEACEPEKKPIALIKP